MTTRTRAKADALLDAGASWADSPAGVADASDVVFVMVGYPAEVEEVVLGASQTGEGGVLTTLAPGGVLVDMTTSRPARGRDRRAASDAGLAALDAPVSGGDVGARRHALDHGGRRRRRRSRACVPLLERMGSTIVHQGPAGAGQHTKLTNQIVVAGNIVGVCEALLYATPPGLDVESVLASISERRRRRAGRSRTWRRAIVAATSRPGSSSTTS